MFREMRRKLQQLTDDETEEIFRRGSHGVLSVTGDDGYPYGVPLNYCYEDGKIYFHCAKSGHKTDAIMNDPRVCFTVVDRDDVAEELLTTLYRSAVAFGRARIVPEEEKYGLHMPLAEKYSGAFPDAIRKSSESSLGNMHLVEITVEHMTGKQGRELCVK